MSNRALIIDDEEDIRELLRYTLELAGFEVETLHDGIAALNPPTWYDVILVDLKMPVFDGERLIDYWRMTRPEILRRVIVLSGYSRYTQGRPLPDTFAVIEKPFDHEELTRLIEACAAQSRPDSGHIPEVEQEPKT